MDGGTDWTALIPSSSSSKRKAHIYEADVDLENIQPVTAHTALYKKSRPSSKVARPVPSARPVLSTGPLPTPRPAKLIPAGRSPRKAIAPLRRPTATPYTRVDPPASTTSNPLGFSISAALASTAPVARPAPRKTTTKPTASWVFEIYEDTPEELATNLMEHGACTLDISSDEEDARRERSSGGKENIPPPGDASQTRADLSRSAVASPAKMDLERAPLGEMDVKEFWPHGDEAESLLVVVSDGCEVPDVKDVKEVPEVHEVPEVPEVHEAVPLHETKTEPSTQLDDTTSCIPLQPMERVDSFDVWESASAHGDAELDAVV